jgi:hypothetical protein
VVTEAGVDGRVDSGVARGWEGMGADAGMAEVDGIGSLGSVCTDFSLAANGGE